MTKKRNRCSAKTSATNTIAPRNPLVSHPLMRKGGVHKKSTSAHRAATRRETKRLSRDSSFFQFIQLLHQF